MNRDLCYFRKKHSNANWLYWFAASRNLKTISRGKRVSQWSYTYSYWEFITYMYIFQDINTQQCGNLMAIQL